MSNLVECPECYGEGGFDFICGDCGGGGCRWCKFDGVTKLACDTCEGKGEISESSELLTSQATRGREGTYACQPLVNIGPGEGTQPCESPAAAQVSDNAAPAPRYGAQFSKEA